MVRHLAHVFILGCSFLSLPHQANKKKTRKTNLEKQKQFNYICLNSFVLNLNTFLAFGREGRVRTWPVTDLVGGGGLSFAHRPLNRSLGHVRVNGV